MRLPATFVSSVTTTLCYLGGYHLEAEILAVVTRRNQEDAALGAPLKDGERWVLAVQNSAGSDVAHQGYPSGIVLAVGEQPGPVITDHNQPVLAGQGPEIGTLQAEGPGLVDVGREVEEVVGALVRDESFNPSPDLVGVGRLEMEGVRHAGRRGGRRDVRDGDGRVGVREGRRGEGRRQDRRGGGCLRQGRGDGHGHGDGLDRRRESRDLRRDPQARAGAGVFGKAGTGAGIRGETGAPCRDLALLEVKIGPGRRRRHGYRRCGRDRRGRGLRKPGQPGCNPTMRPEEWTKLTAGSVSTAVVGAIITLVDKDVIVALKLDETVTVKVLKGLSILSRPSTFHR